MLAGPDPVVAALAAGDVASTHNLMAAAARAPCAAAAAARRSFTCAAELGCGSIVRAGPVAGRAAERVGSQGWSSGWGWQLAACGWTPQGCWFACFRSQVVISHCRRVYSVVSPYAVRSRQAGRSVVVSWSVSGKFTRECAHARIGTKMPALEAHGRAVPMR